MPSRSRLIQLHMVFGPDPDLPPLVITQDWIARARETMPELPADKRARFEADLGLTAYDAAQLTMDRATADYFEQAATGVAAGQAKLVANWVLGEVAASLNREELAIGDCPVKPQALTALINRIADGTLSNKIARDVFAAMWAGEHGGDADAIIEAKGLKQINDSGAIGAMVDEVLAAHPDIVEQYHAGKQKAFNSLVGQIMKAAKGKANPQQVNELLKQKLDS